jgi:hypothetical protein
MKKQCAVIFYREQSSDGWLARRTSTLLAALEENTTDLILNVQDKRIVKLIEDWLSYRYLVLLSLNSSNQDAGRDIWLEQKVDQALENASQIGKELGFTPAQVDIVGRLVASETCAPLEQVHLTVEKLVRIETALKKFLAEKGGFDEREND